MFPILSPAEEVRLPATAWVKVPLFLVELLLKLVFGIILVVYGVVMVSLLCIDWCREAQTLLLERF
jgi:hypothetical protein